MQYIGSKNRISKELAPIIQSYITEDTEAYIEPFVGGANMIDKIKHPNKIGSDAHKELVALLKYTRDNSELLPTTIYEEEYIRVKKQQRRLRRLACWFGWILCKLWCKVFWWIR